MAVGTTAAAALWTGMDYRSGRQRLIAETLDETEARISALRVVKMVAMIAVVVAVVVLVVVVGLCLSEGHVCSQSNGR